MRSEFTQDDKVENEPEAERAELVRFHIDGALAPS